MEGKLITSFFAKSITAAKTVNHKVELIKHPSAHILLYIQTYWFSLLVCKKTHLGYSLDPWDADEDVPPLR